MKKSNKLFALLLPILMIIVIISCNKKYDGEETSLETIRNANNKKSYPKTKLDSTQAINIITNQKIRELLELSTLYTSGSRDTEIDSVIYSRMQDYFITKDSNNLRTLLKEMDSLKVRFAKINNLTTSKIPSLKDTLDFANFDVEYYDKGKNHIGTVNRNAQYILESSPVQFKKEFKFYFINFYKNPKDSIK